MARLRLAADPTTGEHKKYNGLMDCLNQVVRREGFTGLYKTFWISLLSVMVFKENYNGISNFLMKHLSNQTQLNKFAVAAISSMFAGLLAYPLETIKARIAVEAGEKD